jgi:hypothetical protein
MDGDKEGGDAQGGKAQGGNAPNAHAAPEALDTMAQQASLDEMGVEELTEEMSRINPFINMQYQALMRAKSDKQEPPPSTVAVFYKGNQFLVFTAPAPSVVDVVTKWKSKALDPAAPSPPSQDDHVAILTACTGLAITDYLQQYIAANGGTKLTKKTIPSKADVLVYACRLKRIPEGTKLPDKSSKAKGGRGGTKASGGLVRDKAADGSDGAVVDMDATAAAVQRARELLKSVRECERANQKLAKAVAAAGVGEGKAAVSDKETMVSGGDSKPAASSASVVVLKGRKAIVGGGIKDAKPSAGGGASSGKEGKAAAGGGASSGKEGKAAAGGGGAAAVADDDGVGKRARRQ